MKTINSILIVLGIIVVALITFKVTSSIKDKELKKQKLELRKEIIKNDSLKKINKGLYTKLVADTLTEKQLKDRVKTLELKLENPEIVIKTVTIPKEVEKEIDGIVVKNSTITIEDFYPDKANPFIKYFATIDVPTAKGVGKFSFNSFDINLGIGVNEDGTYRLNTKVPEWLNVTKIEVEATPLTPVEEDKFGVLLGAGIGQDFKDNSNFLTISTGIRFKKLYLDVQGTSNKTLSTGLKFEF